MAKVAIVSPTCTIGGQDYTAQMANATLDVQGAELDTTNFDSAGWKELIIGELSASFTVDWKKDSDLSGLDAAAWAALTGDSTIAVALKRTGDAIAAGNPEYQFNVKITNWTPIAGQVNQLFGGSTTWPVTGAIVRDVMA